MRILFPFNPLNEKEADGPFNDEYLSLKKMGVECSLFDYDTLEFDELHTKPRIKGGDVVIYRGWMMNPDIYRGLTNLVNRGGGKMLTDANDFTRSHHLPGWYDSFVELTPETIFVDGEEDVVLKAKQSGWDKFFVKDFVKSNYSESGSIANSPTEVKTVVEMIRAHRGEIEGGIALRKVEDLLGDTEQRYFVFNGKPFAPNGIIPSIVTKIAERHKAPFYSVDIVERADGELRLIEIGDGQVSDRKHWDVQKFCEVLTEKA